MIPAYPRPAYLYGSPTLTNLEAIETVHQALPDNLEEWTGALLLVLTWILDHIRNRKKLRQARGQ